MLKSPDEEGTGVVPVSPEELQDVERLVGITLPTPGWFKRGF